jgi:hypothetical protein
LSHLRLGQVCGVPRVLEQFRSRDRSHLQAI